MSRKEKIVCCNCGKTKERYRHIGRKVSNVFCSRDCKSKYGSVEVSCFFCRKKIVKSRSRITRNEHNFCSKECTDKGKGEYMHGARIGTYNGGRTTFSNYIAISDKQNSSSNKRGYILEHRYVMENFIGRKLKKGEVVHHIDRDRTNNDISNLILFPSQSEHIKHHNLCRK